MSTTQLPFVNTKVDLELLQEPVCSILGMSLRDTRTIKILFEVME